MEVTIENLTDRLVLLRLNSGETMHLAPGASSAAIATVEIENNAKAAKLQAQNVIAVHGPGAKAPQAAAQGTPKEGPSKEGAAKEKNRHAANRPPRAKANGGQGDAGGSAPTAAGSAPTGAQ